MKSFLDKVVQELLKNGGNDFSDTTVVLPNRRAGVFFKDALNKATDKAIWAPKVLSIEDFVFGLSGKTKIDSTNLLFTFYQVYTEKVKDPQSLELFANWATTFLSDVNELDLNLIDAKDIYTQLYSIERINRWNPEGAEPTDFQNRHLKFVEQFYDFYTALRSKLTEKKLAYQGMVFRQVAENIDHHILTCEGQRFLFAGFNALTVAEEKILESWKGNGAEIYWDMDAYYADDPIHEAGHYIRKYVAGGTELKINSDYKWKSDLLQNEPKQVHLIAVQRMVAQAQTAASIIAEKLKDKSDGLLSNTAVVLNDEKLLMPLLHALPVELKDVNITMGYGLQNSQSAIFIDKFFSLYASGGNKQGQFYHANVTSILNDSLYVAIDSNASKNLNRTIVNEKKVYVDEAFMATSALNKHLFKSGLNDVSVFLEELKKLIGFMHDKLQEKQDLQIEMEFLFLFNRLTQRLIDLIAEYGNINSVRTLHQFWKQLVRREQLDFVGEPLRGIQIMGMLETRNLDFEDVIILGVNEGQLPSSSHTPSYFTFDVRRAFGLACQNERDAVTGYHFYRLLQRTRSAYLIYDQDTDSFGRGEVSRYVRQLTREKGKNITFTEWNIDQHIPNRPFAPDLNIDKGSVEIEKIKRLAERGFSPSALNTFRNCSLKYYFKYVADFKEPKELNEEVDHARFGLAVHAALEELYKPYLNRPLSEEILKSFMAKAKAELENQFQNTLALDGNLEGRNLLAFEVGLVYVKRVIEHDLKTTRSGILITPLSLEEKLTATEEMCVEGNDITANYAGYVDRIDRLSNGTIRIIDYKTGSFKKTVKIKSVEELDSTKTDYGFQLLTYAFMYSRKYGQVEKLQPTIFFLQSKQVEFPIEVLEDRQPVTDAALVDYAVERIRETTEKIFDTNVGFSQTDELKTCKYCDFNQVCQR